MQTKLPHKLQIEESISLYYDQKLFQRLLEENVKSGELKRNKKIRFYVTDSTSKTYYTSTPKTVNELLNASVTKKKWFGCQKGHSSK